MIEQIEQTIERMNDKNNVFQLATISGMDVSMISLLSLVNESYSQTKKEQKQTISHTKRRDTSSSNNYKSKFRLLSFTLLFDLFTQFFFFLILSLSLIHVVVVVIAAFNVQSVHCLCVARVIFSSICFFFFCISSLASMKLYKINAVKCFLLQRS